MLNSAMSNNTYKNIFDTVYFRLGYFFIGGTYYAYLTSDSGSAFLYVFPVSPVNVWHHVCAVRPGGSGLDADIYIDGASAATGNDGEPSSFFNLSIGGTGGTGQYWTGIIDEARIYNRLLTAPEITSLYNYTGPINGVNFR
jgi:hypothetical protein